MRRINADSIDKIEKAFSLLTACARGSMAVIADNSPSPLEARVAEGLDSAVRDMEEALGPVFNAPLITKGGAA